MNIDIEIILLQIIMNPNKTRTLPLSWHISYVKTHTSFMMKRCTFILYIYTYVCINIL